MSVMAEKVQAESLIVNELYDLDDVTVPLVTGFPRLPFSDVLSPIGTREPVAQFPAALGEGGQDQPQARPRDSADCPLIESTPEGDPPIPPGAWVMDDMDEVDA
jgi:hypothetical protein